MNQYHSLEAWLSWMDELSEKNYVVIDHFLDEEHFSEARNFFHSKLPLFKKAGIGALHQHTVKPSIRGDYTYWLDRKKDEQIDWFWKLADEMISMFNRYCYLSLSGYEFHFTKYPPRGHYERHLDQFNSRSNRMISVVIYLNPDWKIGDGGELEIYHRDETVSIQPIGARCVIFKSAEVPHSVLTSFQDRYSLTGWLLYKPPGLGQLAYP